MFGCLMCPNLSLVEFWVQFGHAMESQRHLEWNAKYSSLTSFPELKAAYKIEKYARNIYTHMNFYVFQRQLMETIKPRRPMSLRKTRRVRGVSRRSRKSTLWSEMP